MFSKIQQNLDEKIIWISFTKMFSSAARPSFCHFGDRPDSFAKFKQPSYLNFLYHMQICIAVGTF